jgi:hypothetical protein
MERPLFGDFMFAAPTTVQSNIFWELTFEL